MGQFPGAHDSRTRVLHVFGGLDRGGAETWLYHVLQNWDDLSINSDVLVHRTTTGAYEPQLQALGVKVLRCLHANNPLRYWQDFSRLMRQHGPYEVLHSHLNYRAGFVLALGRRCGIPVRVAHSHNDTSVPDRALFRRPYAAANRALVRRFATHGLATSAAAAASMFGTDWRNDGRWRLHYSCVDLRRYRSTVDRETARTRFGVPSGTLVLGHVGRFTRQKNQRFLLDVAKELTRRGTDFRMFLVGAGPEQSTVSGRLDREGLQSRVTILPSNDNVPELMLGLFDVFVFPSLFEGLGLAAVEAQAAGLPCVISDRVPEEAVFAADNVIRVAVDTGAGPWSDAILSAARRRQCPRMHVEPPPMFDLKGNAAALTAFYRAAVGGSVPQRT